MAEYMDAAWDLQGLVQMCTAILMVRIVFNRKKGMAETFGFGIVCTAGMMLSNGLFNLAGKRGILPEPAGFLIFYMILVLFASIYAFRCLQGSRKQLSMTVLFQAENLLLVYMMANISADSIGLSGTARRAAIYFVSSGALVLLAILYRRVTCPILVNLPAGYWLLVDFTQLLGVLLIVFGYGRTGMERIFYDAILLVLDFTIYMFMIRMCTEMEKQLEVQKANQSLQFQVRQMENENSMLENVRKVRHELKNNYFYIETLIREQKDEEALKYMEEVIRPSFAKEEMVHTGNHLVDMILSQKISEARQQNIPISAEVHLPADLAVEPEMLCSLLFNLLNNAIEASRKVAKPQISFVMSQVRGYIEIQVSNRIEGSVLKDNPKLQTSKKDSRNHGIGMGIIREIVRRYHGDLHIGEKDGRFAVDVMIANEKAE